MSDHWVKNIAKLEEEILREKDYYKKSMLEEKLSDNIDSWIRERAIPDSDLKYNEEEYQKQNDLKEQEEGFNKLSLLDSKIELIGAVIEKAVRELNPIIEKLKPSELIHAKRVQADAYRFLFDNDNLERFLTFWSMELDVDFLRSKLRERVSMANMHDTNMFRKNTFLTLESIGK